MSSDRSFHVGFDIGGTFTDAVALEPATGYRYVAKTLTTSHDPAIGAMTALTDVLAEAQAGFDDLRHAVHGTTIVTNAILQRHGVKTALITTKGFRDVLQIGRELRYDVYNITAPFPEPLITRQRSFEVPERSLADGTILTPLDIAAAEAVLEQVKASGAEAIAVCFLHAYQNATNELAMGEVIERVLPGMLYSLSSQVVPEFREYERMSTTAANAYTQPLVDNYLSNLSNGLVKNGYERGMYVMMSTGGITTTETAVQFPVRLLESGPAAGALATGFYGRHLDEPQLLAFDMGGTTAKACIVDNGAPTRTKYFETGRVERFIKGSGLPIRSPVIDMIEIGAGGGSIAHVSKMGLLQVGPESAEANPGPVCYGQGGIYPTVTDADLTLGYLDPAFFAGGAMRLEDGLAADAIRDHVAAPLNMETIEGAWGIYQVVNESMASAARVHFAEKGRDPRGYTLLAFGGAGPLHAVAVARRLRITDVLVPSQAGVLSAFGFLTAPISFDFIRTYITRIDRANWSTLQGIYEELEAKGQQVLSEAGVPLDDQQLIRTADMRYAGQLFEITVPVPVGELSDESWPQMAELFHKAYHELYGRHSPEAPIEALNWRLLATGPTPAIDLAEVATPDDSAGAARALKGSRSAYFGDHGGWQTIDVYDRYRLLPGDTASGPAVIEERESTIVVPPATEFRVDEYLNVRLTLHSEAGGF